MVPLFGLALKSLAAEESASGELGGVSDVQGGDLSQCLALGINRRISSSRLGVSAAEGTKASQWLKVWRKIADGEMLGEHNLFSVSERKVRGLVLRGSGHLPVRE